MTTTKSELYVKSSSLVDEKICIGLFVSDENNLFFDYSKKKLALSLKLIKSLDKNTTIHWLDNLKEKIREDHKNDELGLFRTDFNRATLAYLNTYSKGVFYFSEPKPISAEVNADYFNRLFKRLVDSEMTAEMDRAVEKSSFRKKVRSILKTEPFKKIDTSYEVIPDLISGIYAPHKIDFIGKNGSLLAGDSIDFHAAPATIAKSLFEFDRIARGLKNLASKRKLTDEGAYYAYFSPPESEEGKKVLDFARSDKNKSFVLKELDHMEKLAVHIEEDDYTKFSDWIMEH